MRLALPSVSGHRAWAIPPGEGGGKGSKFKLSHHRRRRGLPTGSMRMVAPIMLRSGLTPRASAFPLKQHIEVDSGDLVGSWADYLPFHSHLFRVADIE